MLAKALAGLALATVALVTTGAGPQGSAPVAAAQTMNHAAIVVDTGDGQVRKMCLAFPEAEIDGIEALRRVDTRPYRFETFGSKGAGVCMLCGVGCPSGDCFCDPSRFWAYHRAGPGETEYQTSRLGASATKVRDGDVEAWKWGTGAAPEKTTVAETCNVPEPPRRTAATTTTTPPTTEPANPTPSTPTTPPQEESPPPTATPAAPKVPAPPGSAPTSTTAPTALTSTPPGEAPAAVDNGTEVEEADADVPGAEATPSFGAEDGAAASTSREEDEGGSGRSLAGAIGFGAAMAGLLAWRIQLRRAKVRPVRPVR